jgi:DNA-directed RNA polymerase subunit M/transcription elongation factor TFIIS
MPESFIPVWMSIGEAEEFRRFLQEEARSSEGEFPEREFELIDTALRDEKPRSFQQMEAEAKSVAAPMHDLTDDDRARLEGCPKCGSSRWKPLWSWAQVKRRRHPAEVVECESCSWRWLR